MSDAKFDAAFAKGDADGSGGISEYFKNWTFKSNSPQSGLPEAIALVKDLGMSYPDAKVEEYFKKFDADNSGELDKEEAKALVKELFPEFFK